MSIGLVVSYSDGACRMIMAIPATQATKKSQRKKRSRTMATNFQSSITFRNKFKFKSFAPILFLFSSFFFKFKINWTRFVMRIKSRKVFLCRKKGRAKVVGCLLQLNQRPSVRPSLDQSKHWLCSPSVALLSPPLLSEARTCDTSRIESSDVCCNICSAPKCNCCKPGKKEKVVDLRFRIDPCSSYVERWSERLRWNDPPRRVE